MSGKLVTVFGGSGFIGRHLVWRLARQGWRVRVAVRRPDKALFLKSAGDVGQVKPIQANLRHAGSVARAVEGVDAVVNLVGILAEGGRQRFETIQARGPGLVAREAAKAGITSLVQISAIGADPNSPSRYARTKAAGEAAAREHVPETVVVRPSIVFGPEDDFFNRFAAMARLSPVLPLIGGGETRFQPVYVGDVADAIVAALNDPDARGRTYELGGPVVRTFRELMETMLAVIERRRLLVPVPFPVATALGAVCRIACMPLSINPPLTDDQVRLLKRDNVVPDGALTLADLGIVATGMEAVLPTYLYRFRRTGQYRPDDVSPEQTSTTG